MARDAGGVGPRTPDGIGESHVRPVAGWRRHASPLSLVILGGVIVAGLLGLFGHERAWSADASGVTLRIESPETIRNGEFFEMRIRVAGDRSIAEPVVGIESSLWEDMTVNTMIPSPVDEESSDGEFRFTFAPMESGTEFLLKVDLQVNPDILGGNEGTVTVYDADERIVEAEIEIDVLP